MVLVNNAGTNQAENIETPQPHSSALTNFVFGFRRCGIVPLVLNVLTLLALLVLIFLLLILQAL